MKNSWLEPKAFWIAFSLMALGQIGKIQQTGASINALILALVVSIVGGVFWGAIGTYVYNRFYKKP